MPVIERERRSALFPKAFKSLVLLMVFICRIPVAAAQDETPLPEPGQTLQNHIRALIIPVLETTFSSGIDGLIKEIRVDFGSPFKRGQDLLVFDCDTFRGELDKAGAEFEQARKTLEVNRRLESLQSISELEVAVAEARMEMTRAELGLKEIQVKKCVLKAPFSGKVLKREVNPFEYVKLGQPLLQVIADRDLRLQLFVPSQWLKWISTGTPFTIGIDETGENYKAKIVTLGGRVDPVSQTLEVRGVIEGTHPELLAGMSGSASFEVK